MVHNYVATGGRGERVPGRHESRSRGKGSSTSRNRRDCVIAYYRGTRNTKGRVTDTYPTAATIQYQARTRLIYNGKVTTLHHPLLSCIFGERCRIHFRVAGETTGYRAGWLPFRKGYRDYGVAAVLSWGRAHGTWI